MPKPRAKSAKAAKRKTPGRTSPRPLAAAAAAADDPIKHVIVLMMENRSFDHFLGALRSVDGVNPNSPNVNLERPGSTKRYAQTPDAVRKMSPDPHHETKNVMRQIDGAGLDAMGGFVYDFALEEPKSANAWPQVMSYFAEGALPALHRLAKEFCICDPWFSSVPGPTWTNRFFAHSGTSQGWVNMPSPPLHPNMHKYDQTTLYDRLNERSIPWRIYVGDIPQSLLLNNQRQKPNRARYSRMANFYRDIVNTRPQDFPAYTFIEPAYLPFGQNDQHPPHDVLKGDDLIASIYNALRARKDLWDSTLFIVTWDEHGGFYDHVAPPPAIPPDHNVQEGFGFDRYGVRVPTILISRWVTPRSVFAPKRGVLDHTSILRYLSDKYSLGPLGSRTASAASIADAIITVANDQTPTKVGLEPRPIAMTAVTDQAPPTLNKNQAALIDFTKQLEVDMRASPTEVGVRAMRAASGLEGEVESAKERVRLFLADAG